MTIIFIVLIGAFALSVYIPRRDIPYVIFNRISISLGAMVITLFIFNDGIGLLAAEAGEVRTGSRLDLVCLLASRSAGVRKELLAKARFVWPCVLL